MTVQEAINQLNDLIQDRQSLCNGDTEHDAVYVDDISALKIAVVAISRQIPKKIELFNGQASCPNCKKLFGNYNDLKEFIIISWHCKYCGQALDWSDEE